MTQGRNCLPAGCGACEELDAGHCNLFDFDVLCNSVNPSLDYLQNLMLCKKIFQEVAQP